MSRSWSRFAEFNCTNGCYPYGVCSGHKMRLVWMNASDSVVVEIDPDETIRPGDSKHEYMFDDDTFNTMVDLAMDERVKWSETSGRKGS